MDCTWKTYDLHTRLLSHSLWLSCMCDCNVLHLQRGQHNRRIEHFIFMGSADGGPHQPIGQVRHHQRDETITLIFYNYQFTHRVLLLFAARCSLRSFIWSLLFTILFRFVSRVLVRHWFRFGYTNCISVNWLDHINGGGKQRRRFRFISIPFRVHIRNAVLVVADVAPTPDGRDRQWWSS